MLRNAASDTDLHITDLFCFDGILNAGQDAPHDSAKTSWTDLTGNSNAYNYWARDYSPLWGDNCWRGDGGKRLFYFNPVEISSRTVFTIEFVCTLKGFTRDQSSGERWGFAFNNQPSENFGKKRNFSIHFSRSTSVDEPKVYVTAFGGSVASGVAVNYNELLHFVVSCDGTNVTAYLNGSVIGSKSFTSNDFPARWWIGNWNYNFFFVGDIYRIGADSKSFTVSDAVERFGYFKRRFS